MIISSAIAFLHLVAPAGAAPLVITDPAERIALYQRAVVWERPTWISDDFIFSPDFDVNRAPVPPGESADVTRDQLDCVTTTADQIEGDTRGSAKFKCQLLRPDSLTGELTPVFKKNGDRQTLKIKYMQATKENPEVYAEVFGTRLFWALGFPSDSMFPVETVRCYGCAADPFVERKVDPSTMQSPRIFTRTAVELKYTGQELNFIYHNQNTGKDQIAPGWTFANLLKILPTDPTERARALEQRDALRLLGVLIHHIDNKSVNQRVVCPTSALVDRKCVGRPIFMVHDLGAILGVTHEWAKLDFDRWIRDPLWKSARECIAQMKFPGLADPSMEYPVISESGRRFLTKLLVAFSEGEAGRARVRALFQAARLDKRPRPQTLEMWVDAFLSKVNEVRYPLGVANPDFRCPQP